jgi:hypothetical protein
VFISTTLLVCVPGLRTDGTLASIGGLVDESERYVAFSDAEIWHTDCSGQGRR